MDEALDADDLQRELDRLRAELTRLERERAVEQGELRSAVARADALQAALDRAPGPLGAPGSIARRAVSKGRRVARRVARRIIGR
ncbi:hypothetical protein [Agrococcus sp. DT81.2]|uniref:hypothetical protein n=1 Tax=Agrococcus sp. DT81.2 TaxID=3393414 RepID=UPI003CE47AA7